MKPTSARIKPPLILVVGMHRSGTSLLGSLLEGLGVTLPGQLIPGDIHNPDGYYEWEEITNLQEQLLIDLGRWWPSAKGAEGLPEGWLEAEPTQACRTALAEQLLKVSSQQTGPWAIKDPRTSLLLPLWLELGRKLGLSIRIVLSIRHPAEVVQSLRRRDSESAGMTAARAELIWWHHNQTVLREASGSPLLVVDYSRWFEPSPEPGSQLQRLNDFCQLKPITEGHLERCLARIQPGHRRSVVQAEELLLNPRSLALYKAIQSHQLRKAKRLRPWSWRETLRSRRWQQAAETSQSSTPDPGVWFDPDHYRTQWPGLRACSREGVLAHYRQAGWISGSTPHPQFDLRYYDKQCKSLNLHITRNPLDHFINEGQQLGLQPIAPDPGSWFDHGFYSRQCPGLAHTDRDSLLRHYRHVGAELNLKPHPLFDPDRYERVCRQSGIAVPSETTPLDHWLQKGLELGLSPHRLIETSWLLLQNEQARGHAPIKLADIHPWGALAENWSAKEAYSNLDQWQSDGLIAASALQWLIEQSDLGVATVPWRASSHHTISHVVVLGGDLRDWRLHTRFQHIPIKLPRDVEWLDSLPANADNPASGWIVVNRLTLQELNQNQHLASLRQAIVFDEDHERLKQLRYLGLDARALHIDPQSPTNPLPAELAARATAHWGLPPLTIQTRPGVLVLGEHGRLWEDNLDSSLWCLPAFHQLRASCSSRAQELAAWLNQAQRLGSQLVLLDSTDAQENLEGFRSLQYPSQPSRGWSSALHFRWELSPQELHRELQWRLDGCPDPKPCHTPIPQSHLLHEHCSSNPKAAVCISLYNYAPFISAALESVKIQTLSELELIVVDDASQDDGNAIALEWLEQNQRRFSRTALLKHDKNGGLAAARNTAFGAAKSPWCFVLDADNRLCPQAVEHCLALAEAADPKTAVIHPLVRIRYDAEALSPRSLLSRQSWQSTLLAFGNYIDAMALVRRSAWESVGGFTHIEGGWEDFDFWCKIVDAGLHGALCPEVLAIYRVHANSMSGRSTRRLERPLSRLLQHRHPWLRLPLANDGRPAVNHD